MKKTIFLIIAISLCIVRFFVGCSREAAKTDTRVEFCRVLCLDEDDIIVWIPEIGNVYVRNVDPALEIDPLDTVVMEFSVDDLEAADGAFTDYFGEEQTYSHILENPVSMRHTKPDEPTYG